MLSTTTGYQLRSFGEAAARARASSWCSRPIAATRSTIPGRTAPCPCASTRRTRRSRRSSRPRQRRPIDGVLAGRRSPGRARGARGGGARAAVAIRPKPRAASANKRLARERVRGGGPAVPVVLVDVRSPADAARDPRRRAIPCVVKPVGLSGSRGVIRADTRRELAAAFAARARAARRGRTCARRGPGCDDRDPRRGLHRRARVRGRRRADAAARCACFAIFDKPDPLDGPFFEETIYVTPSALAARTQAAIVEQVERAARGAGPAARTGPRRVPRRPPAASSCSKSRRGRSAACARGCCSSQAAARADAQPMPLEEVLLRHALGEDVGGLRRGSAGRRGDDDSDSASAGILKRVEGRGWRAAVPGVDGVRITAKQDQLLEPLPEAGSYLGFIFARAADRPRRCRGALRAAHAPAVVPDRRTAFRSSVAPD